MALSDVESEFSNDSGRSYDTPPCRLGVLADGEEDIHWIQARMPSSNLERQLLERDYIEALIDNPATSNADRTRAREIRLKRINNRTYRTGVRSMVATTLNINSSQKVKNRKKQSDLILPAPTGNEDTIDDKVLKSFPLLAGNNVYYGPSGSKGQAGLRQILTAANNLISKKGYTARASFSLVRNCFKGEALSLLQIYSAQEKWASFFLLIQSVSKTVKSNAALMKEILTLIQTRPDSASLSNNVVKLMTLHQQLSEGMPPEQRIKNYETSANQSLRSYVLSWYATHLAEVDENFELDRLAMKQEVSRLRAAGDDNAADMRLKAYCPVSSYCQAIMATLPNYEPSPAINQQVAIPSGNSKDKNKRHAHAVQVETHEEEPHDDDDYGLALGADASTVAGNYHAQAPADYFGLPLPGQGPHGQVMYTGYTQNYGQQDQGRGYNQHNQGQVRQINGPICRRCRRHSEFDVNGRRNRCFRYPNLAPGEIYATCEHCGCAHYSSNCMDGVPLSQMYPEGRPDRRLPPAPHMASNAQNGNQNNSRRGPNNGNGRRAQWGGDGPLHSGPQQHLHDPNSAPQVQSHGEQNQEYSGARPRQSN